MQTGAIVKHYIHALSIIFLISSGLSLAMRQSYSFNPVSGWYETPKDYSIVNAIKTKSDLSQSDVDKFKLISLGRFQDVAAIGIGSYATYKGGTGAYQALDMLGQYGPSGDNKFFWALAGAAGVGLGAYKFLYPRISAGVLQQVKTFINMCENLDVYNFRYERPEQLSYLGTSNVNKHGKAYDPAWRRINAAWSDTNIARKKGIDNLLEQCRATIQLIAQLESTAETKDLNDKARWILSFLDDNSVNYQTIAYAAKLEAQQRANQISAENVVIRGQIQLAQDRANVQVAQQQASALWYGKISLAATAMSNLVSNSLRALVYMNDNKEKIIGGGLIAAAAVYGSFNWLQSKLAGN